MNKTQPLVSVILPVYNAGAVLKESVASILHQKYRHIELIIYDDGSGDNPENIISRFKDPRIRFIRNEKNEGLIKALNNALKKAEGELIARMDADDISHPDRILRQVNYMANNLHIAVSGTAMHRFGADHGRSAVTTDPDELSAELLFRIPFNHPTVIMRRIVVEKNPELYDSRFPHAEDLELWHRLSKEYKFGNINYPLLNYRTHSLQVTQLHKQTLENSVTEILKASLQRLTDFTHEEFKLHLGIYRFENPIDVPFQQYVNWLEKLNSANMKCSVYPEKQFERICAGKLQIIKEQFTASGRSVIGYENSHLKRTSIQTAINAIRRKLKG